MRTTTPISTRTLLALSVLLGLSALASGTGGTYQRNTNEIGAAMMDGPAGQTMTQEVIDEAVHFRQALARCHRELGEKGRAAVTAGLTDHHMAERTWSLYERCLRSQNEPVASVGGRSR